MSGPRKSFYILLPIFSGLFALLLIELGLALFYPIPFSLEKNMYFEPDPYTGFRQRPLGAGYYPSGIEALANSRGHRDNEVQIPKPEGVLRILLLGDSFTVGANVEMAEAYPQELEKIYALMFKRRVEVVNAGVGGWSPFQYAQYYEHYGDQFEPDLIVIGFFAGNDTYINRFTVEDTRTAVLGRRVSRQAGTGWWTKSRILLYENSHIARALMTGGGTKLSFVRKDCASFDEVFLAIQKKRVFNHAAVPTAERKEYLQGNVAQLQRIKNRAAEKEIPVVVVMFPDENQVNPELQAAIVGEDERDLYDYSMPQKLVQEMLEERGIDSLDLREAFVNDPRCLYMNDTHWTVAGHFLVAQRIYEYILSNDLLRAQ